MSDIYSLRSALGDVLDDDTLDAPAEGPFVNYRQVANRLVQEAISGTNPIEATRLIVQILQIPDPVPVP